MVKPFSYKVLFVFLWGIAAFCAGAQTIKRERYAMDRNWKFHLGNAADPAKDFDYGISRSLAKAGEGNGVLSANFDDKGWRTVQVPHDWVVETDFANVKNEQVLAHGYKRVGALFPESSIGWYRKSFFVSAADSGNRFQIHFDGVFRNYHVFLNGHFLGNQQSGYTESSFDVTDYLNFHQKNELVVRVDATQSEGWFYEGAGIYRHVWLDQFGPLYIPEYGTYINTTQNDTSATVFIATNIMNRNEVRNTCQVEYSIVDSLDKKISGTVIEGVSIVQGENKKIKAQLKMVAPRLWSLSHPYLYKLVTVLRNGNIVLDSTVTNFGVRSIQIDKDKGLLVNGIRVKIHGVNCHQDHAGVGTALPDGLQYYRLKKLKEMGVNAYRTAHHPPTPELLNACDQLGILVLDENRLMGTSKEYLDEFEHLILRDRNHPAVFLWSIGNEEGWIQTTNVGRRIAQTLVERQKELDPSRTCTYAADMGNEIAGINEVIPVRGFNYRIPYVDDYHSDHPTQPIIGTETGSTVCTRGVYTKDTILGYVPDHDITYPWWASSAEQWWKPNAGKDWFMGGFVWTGFDYRGEPTPFEWPNINSHFGIMDVCGFPKNNYFYYKSWWGAEDVLQISPHWNWKNGDVIPVWVNSNAEQVELFLNGKSLGKKKMEPNSHLEWTVKYQPGKLSAIGWRNGHKMNAAITTTGSPVKIMARISADSLKANGEDVSIIDISVVDQNGLEVQDAMNEIYFDLTGAAKIIGVGNGNPSSHEPDCFLVGKWKRKLFNGKCQLIVQSLQMKGKADLHISGQGLESLDKTIIIEELPSNKTYVKEKM